MFRILRHVDATIGVYRRSCPHTDGGLLEKGFLMNPKHVGLYLTHKRIGCEGIFLIVPEDVPMALIGIYGFAPPFLTGRDHRVGFGFRFGNHADLQVMYEFGPQTRTKPLQPIKIRSATYRERVTRRRPLLGLLLRAGLLREVETQTDISYDVDVDQPR